MKKSTIFICLFFAFLISGGFILSSVYTYAWVTDVPKSLMHNVIRFIYFPHALASGAVLEGIREYLNSPGAIYSVALLVTVPISFIYMFLTIKIVGFARGLWVAK